MTSPVMIDWLSFTIPWMGADICGGRMVHLDADGTIKFETALFQKCEGSFSSSFQVRTVPGGLYFTGNPSKYFQGHNVFGSCDLIGLASDVVLDVLTKLDYLDLSALTAVRVGNFEISRVDLTASFDLPSLSDVRSWLRAAISYGSGRRQKTQVDNTTFYCGFKSRRIQVKIYGKYDELKVHPPTLVMNAIKNDVIHEFARNKLRVELMLRSPVLIDMNLRHGFNWNKQIAEATYYSKIKEKLILPGVYEMTPEEIESMEKKYRRAYELWKTGGDLINSMSRASFFRYKKHFIDQYGIDITKQMHNRETNVIPLIRVLEAVPAEIPEEAFKLGLIHQPKFSTGR